MKKTKLIIPFLLIIPWLYSSAQESKVHLDLSAFGGYATYDMADLKSLNSFTQKNLPFETEEVNNFDPGYYLGGSLRTTLSTYAAIGLFYQHNSTGSRIGRKDYSGIYTFDQIVDCDIVGLEPELFLLKARILSLSASLQTGALFSKINMKEYLEVGETVKADNMTFKAFSVVFCPSFRLSVPVIKPFCFFLSAGWMIDSGGKVYHVNKDNVLTVDGKEIKTGWSGLRLAAGLKLNLTK